MQFSVIWQPAAAAAGVTPEPIIWQASVGLGTRLEHHLELD